jgi:phenylpropionate dioxygenase-like ring-hydroxylating dioxygenase large terminal subunit
MSISDKRLPLDCTYSENNWRVLASFWHPIAISEDIGSEPVAATLLDQKLVIYRTSMCVTVANSKCPHRGASLTLGRIRGEHLICGYHGLYYDHDGKCIKNPYDDSNTKTTISKRLCLTTYPVIERYGLIWTCLAGEAREPLPEWQALEDANVQIAAHMDFDVKTSAGRYTENFNDLAHTPWIHEATFSTSGEDMECTKRASVDLKETTNGIYVKVESEDQNKDTFGAAPVNVSSEYFCTFPFTSYLKMDHHDLGNQYYFLIMSPTSSKTTRAFMVMARDYDKEKPVDEFVAFQELVNEEDRVIVESQVPAELPLDPSLEINTSADFFSAAYRRGLKKLGIDGPLI